MPNNEAEHSAWNAGKWEQFSGSRSMRVTFEQYREASAPQHMDLPQVQIMTVEHAF